MKVKGAHPGHVASMNPKQSQFDALVRATHAELYRFGYWLCGNEALAHDLTQETYLRAWRSLDDLRDSKAVKAWLTTILRREHARLFERKAPTRLEPIEELDLADEDWLGPEQGGEDSIVRRAIHALDVKYREPLLMQVLGGFSCEEIARELKLTPAAVMTQLFRARQKLKVALSGRDVEGSVHELS
ncbi:MAG: sigma-70 family RNA polymerase sigma factor [Pseudomonadota bacterium]|nr:sigma-70 family RNA polymerase sigma factor [Pseudomonadota bacterium]